MVALQGCLAEWQVFFYTLIKRVPLERVSSEVMVALHDGFRCAEWQGVILESRINQVLLSSNFLNTTYIHDSA